MGAGRLVYAWVMAWVGVASLGVVVPAVGLGVVLAAALAHDRRLTGED